MLNIIKKFCNFIFKMKKPNKDIDLDKLKQKYGKLTVKDSSKTIRKVVRTAVVKKKD